MAIILNIETATTVCSVSLSKDAEILSLRENLQSRSHAETLTLLITEVFSETGLVLSDINAISVSMGPGSYTGLRIGVSTAKGLCMALDKPLLGINTLHIMACRVLEKLRAENSLLLKNNILLCPMIDARRMEVYTALYDSNSLLVKASSADIIDADSFDEWLKDHTIVFFGDGAEKCKPVLEGHTNALFIDHIFPSAANMMDLSIAAFKNNSFVDVAYFEPFYLKDFFTPPPKLKKQE
jgi:tRNA threonylcarbamoyladenosine biosynthesis protein TsaB